MERGGPEKAATALQEKEERREKKEERKKENEQRSQDKMFIT